MKALDLLRCDRKSAFEVGLLRAHSYPQVLDRARVDPLLGMVRDGNDHQRLAHREALAHRAEPAINYYHIGVFDQSPVVEELAVKMNSITAIPIRRDRPPHDVEAAIAVGGNELSRSPVVEQLAVKMNSIDSERPVGAIERDR